MFIYWSFVSLCICFCFTYPVLTILACHMFWDKWYCRFKRGHVELWPLNIRNILTTAMALATILGLWCIAWGFPPIKLHDPLNNWSCKIVCQTKIRTPLPECLWPPNIAGWQLTLMSSCP